MMHKKDVISTSTPTNRLVHKRKSIHDKDNDLSAVSPITKSPNKDEKDFNSESDENDSSDQEQPEKNYTSSDKSKSHNSSSIPVMPRQNKSFCGWKFSLFVFIIGVSLTALYASDNESNENRCIDLNTLKSIFPTQDVDTWNIIESGVNEVKSFHKPSVFLFLYKSDAEQTLQNLLKNISIYISCALNKEHANPLILSSEQLVTNEAKNDYGHIIHKYRGLLDEKGVMVVKNLDEIPSSIARAFHTICDEFTPLVERSVIIFTVNVYQFPHHKMELEYVEKILRDKWKDIAEDELSPLLTRVLSMVLKILPENIAK